MRTAALALATAILAAAVPASAETAAPDRGEARIAKALEGRVAGEPVRCLQQHLIRSSEIIDRTAILYRTADNKLYLNRPEFGRESLNRYDVMVTDTRTGQLCDIDTVRLLDQGSRMQSGVVGLGVFTPYTKVANQR